jgi:hypothetical protein
VAAEFHLAEHALALHFLLQHLEGLVDIVVTDENLHVSFLFNRAVDGPGGSRDTTKVKFQNVFVPAGGIMLRIGGSGDFGTSPFLGSSQSKHWLACI